MEEGSCHSFVLDFTFLKNLLYVVILVLKLLWSNKANDELIHRLPETATVCTMTLINTFLAVKIAVTQCGKDQQSKTGGVLQTGFNRIHIDSERKANWYQMDYNEFIFES